MHHLTLAPKRVRGFTIIELILVVAVSSLLVTAIAASNRFENRKAYGKTLGESYKPMAQALQDYVQANRFKLTQDPAVVAGVVNPLAPTIAELRALNLYSSNFPLTIPSNNGAPVFKIARIPTGCTPAACDLEYFVGNTVPDLGDDGKPNEGALAYAAAAVGSTAGYSTSLTPSVISGRGGWTYTNPNGLVGGIFGIYTTYSQSGNSAFVRMQDIRDPDLQAGLTVKDTTASGKLQVNDIVVVGATCSPNGLIAKDASGLILSCQSGIWATTQPTVTPTSPPRSLWATYTNNTNGMIFANVCVLGATKSDTIYAWVGAQKMWGAAGGEPGNCSTLFFLVPKGWNYSVGMTEGGSTLISWTEWR